MSNTHRNRELRDEIFSQWGEVEDYYPGLEAIAKKPDWEESREAFAELVVVALTEDDKECFAQAKRIEAQWGDTPLWNRLAAENEHLK